MAKSLGVTKIRCLYFTIEKEICMEHNALRKVGTHMSKNVPSVCIHTFFKNHVPPTMKEGFTDEIIKIINDEITDFKIK